METNPNNSITPFSASSTRSGDDPISREVASLANNGSFIPVLDAMPDFVMILNRDRQVIFGNRKLREFGLTRNLPIVYGMRFGELLNCGQVASTPAGCGTGKTCTACGSLKSIQAGLSGESVVNECRLSTDGLQAFDLRIWASPFFWDSVNYVLVIAVDISDQKRRQVLEHIFLHDLLNAAGGIRGIAELIEDGTVTVDDWKGALSKTAELLVHQIRSQQILLAAENNEFATTPVLLRSHQVIETVIAQLREHTVAAGKTIVFAPESNDFEFLSDRALLTRVLGNLLKNALEASNPGDTVTLGSGTTEAGSVFWCHNPSVMPPEVQLQVFQRNFSTKGSGRGIGTYSVRLLTERYLAGTVAFESRAAEGTTFRVTLPASGPVSHKV